MYYSYTCIVGCEKPSNFLYVKKGDYVAIRDQPVYLLYKEPSSFWIAQVINCIGGAREPNSWTLFQVLNIDNGEISIVNADTVELIL